MNFKEYVLQEDAMTYEFGIDKASRKPLISVMGNNKWTTPTEMIQYFQSKGESGTNELNTILIALAKSKKIPNFTEESLAKITDHAQRMKLLIEIVNKYFAALDISAQDLLITNFSTAPVPAKVNIES